MAKAKKLPSGSWCVQIYVGMVQGKRKYKRFTAPTKKEAEYKATQYNLERKNDTDPLAITVGQAITRYIDTREKGMSPSTVASYRKIRKNNMVSIMDIPLKELTNEHIQIAVYEESATHRPKTVRNQYALLTAALAAYHPDFTPRAKLPQRNKVEMTIPTQKQLNALISLIRGTEIELPVMLAAFVGLRRSEICALTAADYNAAEKTLNINKAMVKNELNIWVIKPPKTVSGNRRIPVPDPVADCLKRNPLPVNLNPDQMAKRYMRVRSKAGITCRFHDLRHYYASLLLALNIPDKYSMELMGHATPNMLKNVYQHTMEDKKKGVSNAINQAISGIMQHEMQHEPKKTQ